MITGGVLLCLSELPLIERFEYTWDWTDGVEQISVQGSAIFAPHHRRLRVDESFLLQLPHVFCHRVFTHSNCLADGLVAGIALIGFPVLAPEQIGVEGDLTEIQTDAECDAAKLNNKNQQENSEIEQRAKEKSVLQGAAHSFPCCQAEKEQV